MPLRFGDFELDDDRRQLLRSGEPVPLEPKAYALLTLLVERRPRALSRAQIRDAVWPGIFVSESTVNQAMNNVRRALGDDARRPLFVRTVHGFAYAFCGEVHPEAPAIVARHSAMRLVWGDRGLRLAPGENRIGRDLAAGVHLDAASVSRFHARIVVEESGASLEDLGSKNGTRLNGEPIRGVRTLRDGDAVRLGDVRLLFRSLPADDPTASAAGSAARE